MGTATIAPRSRSRELSLAVGEPLLRGIHHLALVTDDMRMTLDFYVRVLGMPIVHGLRTPSRPPGARHAHGNGAPPYSNIPHYFLDMGGDSLLAFFEYPKRIAKADRDAIGAMHAPPLPPRQGGMLCNMFHLPVALHGIAKYWSD